MADTSQDDNFINNQVPLDQSIDPNTEEIVSQSSPAAKGDKTKRTLKRPYNPLSEYSSYTYQISLYMLSPDGYDSFLLSNRTSMEFLTAGDTPKAFLIAQSGGINNEIVQRAPGFQFDLYIDNLKLDTAVAPKSTGTSAALYEMSFDIVEPLGFAFPTNLKLASDSIEKDSSTRGVKSLSNATRQNFVLGVRFFGYDGSGALLNPSGGFEKFYEFVISDMTTKLTGKNTIYHITGTGTSMQIGYGLSRGTVKKGAMVHGSSVQDLLEGNNGRIGKLGLFTKLNLDEEKSGAKEKNVYKVKFVGEDADLIRNATIANKDDIEKSRALMAKAKNTKSVNEALSKVAEPDFTNKTVTFKDDTPILQAIQQIIMQSSYIIDGLNTKYTSDLEANPDSGAPDAETDPQKAQPLRWYNVSVHASNPRFDDTTNQFAFDITYIIQSYKTPVVISPVAKKTDLYYGPVKRYEYWYTGQNSEILRYEQTFDNLYQIVSLSSDLTGRETSGNANLPINLGRKTGGDRTGGINQSLEAQNQLATFLTDPGAYTDVTVEILGDPDYMFNPIPGNPDEQDGVTNPFYGPDGFTINPNTGQVFIEIDFKQAVDYDNTTGTLSLNDKIIFWNYPEKLNIKGVSYQVYDITHEFRGGKFTQKLTCTINTFDDLMTDSGNGRNTENESQAETNKFSRQGTKSVGETTTTTGSGANSGLKPAPGKPNMNASPGINPTITTPVAPAASSPQDDQFTNVDINGNYIGNY